MDLKKAYYYIICLAAALVFAWGAVDFTSAAVGLAANRGPQVSLEQSPPLAADKDGEPGLEMYYQKKILYDRLVDSLARLLISGLIFTYSRKRTA